MYIARYSYFTANIAQVEKENKYMLLISELKSNDYLKVDGRKVDVLLLSLRNAHHLHHDFPRGCCKTLLFQHRMVREFKRLLAS